MESKSIVSNSLNQSITAFHFIRNRDVAQYASLVSPESNLRGLRTTVRRSVCIGCSQRGGSFDKFYGIEERTIFCPNNVRRTPCRCVFHDRLLLLLFDVCTCSWQVDRSYSTGRYCNWLLCRTRAHPRYISISHPVHYANRDLDLYGPKNHARLSPSVN